MCIQITLILSPSALQFADVASGSDSNSIACSKDQSQAHTLETGREQLSGYWHCFLLRFSSSYASVCMCCCGGGSLSQHRQTHLGILWCAPRQTLLCSLASSKKDNRQKSLRETTHKREKNRNRKYIFGAVEPKVSRRAYVIWPKLY